MKFQVSYPIRPFFENQGFGVATLKISYVDFSPTTHPLLGNLSSGIIRILTIFFPSLSKQMQKKKPHGLGLLRLNTQLPNCSDFTGTPRLFFLRYMRHTLTSIKIPSFSRSQPLSKALCLAPRNSAAHFSHLKPIPVSLSQNLLFEVAGLSRYASGFLRKYHALFVQTFEQCLGLLPRSVPQTRHLFIH